MSAVRTATYDLSSNLSLPGVATSRLLTPAAGRLPRRDAYTALTAAALHFVRLGAWLDGAPFAHTGHSADARLMTAAA